MFYQIVPGSDNSVAIDLITTHIRKQLEERSRSFRVKMAHSRSPEHCLKVPPSEDLATLRLHLVEQTPQLKVDRLLQACMAEQSPDIYSD